MTIAQGAGGGNGFFGNVASGLGQAIGNISRDILPVWTAQQLGVQQNDQLSQPTFSPINAPPRNDDEQPTTSGTARTGSAVEGFRRTAVTGSFQVDTLTAVAIIGATILGAVFVAKVT